MSPIVALPDPLPETLEVPAASLFDIAETVRKQAGFDMLLDVTAVDWPAREPRFDVVYHFYSTRTFKRLRVKTRVPEADPTVTSLTSLYGSALFMERECHEMYGIAFRAHPDLRPILLYEGFKGHPLRKDYPIRLEQPLVAYRTETLSPALSQGRGSASTPSLGRGQGEGQ